MAFPCGLENMALVGDAPDPYPALKKHAELGKHERTYKAGGKTICEDCGAILSVDSGVSLDAVS